MFNCSPGRRSGNKGATCPKIFARQTPACTSHFCVTKRATKTPWTHLVYCVYAIISSTLYAGLLHLSVSLGASAGAVQKEGQDRRSFPFSTPPSFCGCPLACLFIAGRRVWIFLPLVDCDVNFCVPATSSLCTAGNESGKNPRSCDFAEIRARIRAVGRV